MVRSGSEIADSLVGVRPWMRFAEENDLNPEWVADQVVRIRSTVLEAFRRAIREVEDDDWDNQVSRVKESLLPTLTSQPALADS